MRIRNRGYGRSDISFIDALGGYFLHQASFIKMSVLEKYGYYDDSYRKNADTYFFITALGFGNASFRYVDVDISNFDTHGLSFSTDSTIMQIGQAEDKRWYGEHISNRMMDLYRTVPTKINTYNSLRKYRVIWFFAMVLVHVSEWLSPTKPLIRKEKM